MEQGSLLPHPQQPANCPYPEPDQSSPGLPIPLLEDKYGSLNSRNSFIEICSRYTRVRVKPSS